MFSNVLYVKPFLFCFFCFLFSISVIAQKPPASSAQGRVTLHKGDTLYQFYTGHPPKAYHTDPEKAYHWYRDDTVLITQGAFAARLLQGDFAVFYPNRNLYQQGQYDYGLKDGTWKTWYPNGQLKSRYGWKRGELHGAFCEYTGTGSKAKEGTYRFGQLTGRFTEYLPSGKAIESYYENGVQQPTTDTTQLKRG